MAVSATGYVQRQGFGAPRSDRDDPQASRINPSTQIRKLVLDFEQERQRQMVERKINAKLTPLALFGKSFPQAETTRDALYVNIQEWRLAV
jgi:anti-sigma-K factor RskA